jgi:uncharacterized protein (TIGR02186 family)
MTRAWVTVVRAAVARMTRARVAVAALAAGMALSLALAGAIGRAQTGPDGMAAQQIIAALSQNRVSITANFSGSQIFVFGAVKRDMLDEGRLEVALTIAGPSSPILVRRKERVLGIWVNRDEVLVDEAPSFYAVAATGPLEEVLSYTDDLRYRIGINHLVRLIGAPPDIDQPETFRDAVIRLRRAEGLYVELPGSIRTVEDTLFAVDVSLPANLVEGDYRARMFLLRDRAVIDTYETAITVRKVGLERWIYALSRERPAAYGLLSIFVALLAGWGASEAFRLLRR